MATTEPGQDYSGRFSGAAGLNFMMQADNGAIIIGNVADLPSPCPETGAHSLSPRRILAPRNWRRNRRNMGQASSLLQRGSLARRFRPRLCGGPKARPFVFDGHFVDVLTAILPIIGVHHIALMASA